MKLQLLRQGEYPEPVRSELQQLVDAIATSFGREHDGEGRQQRIWQRWNLGESLSVAGGSAVVLIPCRLPDALNTGDLVLDSVGGTVTVQTPGTYLVHGQIRWASNATGIRGVQILRNGVAYGDLTTQAITGGIDTQLSTSAMFPCIVGTTISLAGYQSSGGALNATAKSSATHETSLTIARIA